MVCRHGWNARILHACAVDRWLYQCLLVSLTHTTLAHSLAQHSLDTRGLKSVLVDRVHTHLEDRTEHMEQDVDQEDEESAPMASSRRRLTSQVGKRSRK
jgi:hypothetical protein